MSEQARYYKIQSVDNPHFSIQLYLDFFNQRVRLDEYRGRLDSIILNLKKIAAECGFSKVIVKSRQDDWQQFLARGFMMEGVIRKYFSGSDAYLMCLYLTNERRTSAQWIHEDHILEQVHMLPKSRKTDPLASHYTLRIAVMEDAPKLAALYQAVFQTYPTPMNDPKYILSTMDGGTLYYMVLQGENMVSAASAEVNSYYHNAEITDCATLLEHRKHGLMRFIITELERELYQRKVYFLYSLARSLSFGMNAVLYQLGYDYTGRLTNNCYIFDKIENMSIWVKDLTQEQKKA